MAHQVRRDAPEAHIRPQLIEGPDGTEQLYSVEILDICGLSADYCRKCEGNEISSQGARLNQVESDQPQGDVDLRPDGGYNRVPAALGQDQQQTTPQATGNDRHLMLLDMICSKAVISLEEWARQHRFGRTTLFDWKASRSTGKSLKGKVSGQMSAAIENAIEEDADALGLTTRTDSD